MKALVGYTGFVGSNIYTEGQFDAIYNSKNIETAYGTNPDLLIYSGIRAEKYLANHIPEKDMELIVEAEKNIELINPKKLVLISTVDVLKNPNGKNEDVVVDTENLHPYGYNRYKLECWVREHYPDALIIRLPGLFGINLKKNFIYDYINIIPFMLKPEKLQELIVKEPLIERYYDLQENGFYKLIDIDFKEKEVLKKLFKKVGFSALNFTDSRNVYQFYPLKNLYRDIEVALENDIRLWHPATEPISAGELYYYLTGEVFINEVERQPVHYDFKTKYDEVFGGCNGYIYDKETILKMIKDFV